MSVKRKVISLLALMVTLTTFSAANAQTKQYQAMAPAEQTAYVEEQARRIAREISGKDYEFTPAFVVAIQNSVEFYSRRVGNGAGDQLGKGDARFVFERGQSAAPKLIASFKAQNVSPLIGLYLPLVESEYVNVASPNSMGAIGMFQFLPKTGERFGLTAQDLLDVEKSADAAARYIGKNIQRFSSDPMKEALALLSYNRGEDAVQRDIARFVTDQTRPCSICALTAARSQMDPTFKSENVYYVPRFFAAAIIGENPQAFGLQTKPLSSVQAQ